MKPPEIHNHIRAPQAFGEGTFKRLGFSLFHAALWTDAPAWSMEDVFALSIRYSRSFSSHDLVEKSLADMHRLEKLDPATRNTYAAVLDTLFRDVQRDDVITALFLPVQGASFFHNAQPTGQADIILARRFLDIWFSPKTTEPGLRAALLRAS